MKTRITLALAVVLASCTTVPRQSTTPSSAVTETAAIIDYDTIHHPVIANAGMVVSQNAIATLVGREILAQGGNAVDAAVATGFALAVTLPRAGNLGGGGFMLVYLKENNQTVAIDYRSAAPAAFDLDAYRKPDGSVDYDQLEFGAQAAGVPGTVAGLYDAWQRFGTMPWADLLEPAVKLAADGIVVTEDLAFALGAAKNIFATYPASAAAYLKSDGSLYRPGERLIQPDLAWSLAEIGRGGADAFYRGELAERLTSGIQASGGVVSLADLAAYKARDREPITLDYRGHRVVTMPPASGGGLALGQMLNVLSQFDLGAVPQGSAASFHLLAETMKRAAANRRFGIGDPDFVDVPVQGFLSEELAQQMASSINLEAATPVGDIDPIDASFYESRDTTHYSVMDRDGNAVSNTYTLGYSFGSGFVVPGTGILLDNQIRNFSLRDPDHANSIAPGKRMISTMTPTLVLKDNEVRIVTGTPGGSRIMNAILQVLVNVIDYDLNIAEATARPRIYQGWRTSALYVEPGVSADTLRLLEQLGHRVRSQQTMGSTQSIFYENGIFYGAADDRRPGALAAGVQASGVTARLQ
ncbi:MAG: gamma-glutamyltransferase [Pseudomonadota bacterium]